MHDEAARAGTAREPALDGVRGLAILMVVCSHLPPRTAHSDALGLSGVVLFFVLSGYLITRVLLRTPLRPRALAAFAAARVARLVPALLVCVAVVGAIWLLEGRPAGDYARYAIAAICYVENFLAAQNDQTVLGHTWSLAVEEQFYLVWPLLLLTLRRWLPRWSVPLAVALLLAASCALRIVWQQDGLWADALTSLPTNAFAMLAGALLAVAPALRVPAIVGYPVGIFALLSPVYYAEQWPNPLYAGMIASAAGAAVLVCSVGGDAPVFSLRPLRFLGIVSYAWYLWHYPLLYVAGVVHLPPASILVSVGALLPATASTYLIEIPIRQRVRRLQNTAAPPDRRLTTVPLLGS